MQNLANCIIYLLPNHRKAKIKKQQTQSSTVTILGLDGSVHVLIWFYDGVAM